jgi:hypothetical protein
MSENLRTALITGSAVLFGGLIAAGASVATTVVSQNGEDERLERRLDEEARGAARVLFDHLITVAAYMDVTAAEKRLSEPIHELSEEPLPPVDLKRVNGRLSADEFAALEGGLGAIDPFLRVVEVGEGQKLDSDGRRSLRRLQEEVEEGAAALLGVADLSADSAELSGDGG